MKNINRKHHKKICKHCGVELDESNLYPSLKKICNYICKDCWYQRNEYRKFKRFEKKSKEAIKNYKWSELNG